jgi:hypothetical protein
MSRKILMPKTIPTVRIIELLDTLFDEEQDQPRHISEPIIHQIACLIRLITGKKIDPWEIGWTKDAYDLIGWKYKISGSEINFIQ